jgi:RNA polymerase sigma-70 factor (ECF subfamily)
MDYRLTHRMQSLTQCQRSIEEAVCVTIGANRTGRAMSEDQNRKNTEPASSARADLLLEWLERCRTGDTLAMSAIYDHFKSSLYGLAFRYTRNHAVAEDLLQDIFVKVFSNIHTLDNDNTFVGWLYRIAVNTCLSYLRTHKRIYRKEVPLDDVEAYITHKSTHKPEDMMNKTLDAAIQRLSPRLKSVFMLHDIQGFKHEEVAQIMECSVGTSKSQLFKARMKIREYLKKKKML